MSIKRGSVEPGQVYDFTISGLIVLVTKVNGHGVEFLTLHYKHDVKAEGTVGFLLRFAFERAQRIL